MDYNQVFIDFESQLNTLLYGDNVSYFPIYQFIYQKCLDAQAIKTENIRNEIIEFYNKLIQECEKGIENYLINIWKEINNNVKIYYMNYRKFTKNIQKMECIIDFINKELGKLEDNYNYTNIESFCVKSWIIFILNKFIPFLNTEIINLLDFSKTPENFSETSHFIREIIDSIHYFTDNNLIEEDYFQKKVVSKVFNYLEQSVLIFSENIFSSSEMMIITIDQFYNFYIKLIHVLNLEIIENLFISKFEFHVLNKYLNLIENEFVVTLSKFTLDNFTNNFSLDDNLINHLNKCIKYSLDRKNLNNIISDLFNKLDSKLNNFTDKLYLKFMFLLMHDKLDKLNEIYFEKLDEIFDCKFKKFNYNLKELIGHFDKYITDVLYKSPNNINLFIDILIYQLDTDNEEIFVIYKNYLIKRLYKYNFSKKYRDIESKLILEFQNKLKFYNIYKLKKINDDLYTSHELSNEFNNIFKQNSDLIITTPGIWNISSSKPDFQNKEFNEEFNLFIGKANEFYKCKYNNRDLNWNTQLSSCVLNYNIGDKQIQLECSLDQADILFNFNKESVLTLKKSKGLVALVKNKIIIRDGNNFSLNNNFNTKKKFISIRTYKPNKKLKKKEEQEEIITKKDIISLFVVRKLKHDYILEKENLINQVNEKYNYDNDLINKTLEKLVDDCYIEFDNGKYKYLP